MTFAFSPPAQAAVAIVGRSERFPVHRIYCVGRNYAAHAREMGQDPEREPPFFFTKPADAIVANHSTVPYPPRTQNLHHEVELVVAIGRGGSDLTRRDLQFAAGTPAGVSAVKPGDRLEGGVDGLDTLITTIATT